MRGLSILLAFSLTLVSAEACTQKYMEWYKYYPCKTQKTVIDGDCWKIQSNMRDYSLSHEKVWGGSFTAGNVCNSCEDGGQMWCTCTIRAWRFREWMYEPGSSSWPKMPAGWKRVDPDNGLNGWYDTVRISPVLILLLFLRFEQGHKTIDCD